MGITHMAQSVHVSMFCYRHIDDQTFPVVVWARTWNDLQL